MPAKDDAVVSLSPDPLPLTPLPGTLLGKTTLAKGLEAELTQQGHQVEVLDGDEVRERLTKGLGFSKEDRDENIRRISYVARLLVRNGVVTIVSAISPYRDVRDESRREIRSFIEVYVKCPVEECIKRDFKGLYEKALRGEIANFTGVSDPYEPPLSAEVVVETDRESVEISLNKILATMAALGYLCADQEA